VFYHKEVDHASIKSRTLSMDLEMNNSPL